MSKAIQRLKAKEEKKLGESKSILSRTHINKNHKNSMKSTLNHLASLEVKESANPAGLNAILPLLSSRLAVEL
jgi:chemotaxis response regulator CheB